MFFFIYYWCSNILEFAWSSFSLASLRLFSLDSIFDCNYFDFSFNYSRSMSTFWSLSSSELFAKEISSFSLSTFYIYAWYLPESYPFSLTVSSTFLAMSVIDRFSIWIFWVYYISYYWSFDYSFRISYWL